MDLWGSRRSRQFRQNTPWEAGDRREAITALYLLTNSGPERCYLGTTLAKFKPAVNTFLLAGNIIGWRDGRALRVDAGPIREDLPERYRRRCSARDTGIRRSLRVAAADLVVTC